MTIPSPLFRVVLFCDAVVIFPVFSAKDLEFIIRLKYCYLSGNAFRIKSVLLLQ